MLFYLTSRIVCSVAAFLYPGYASYKTLSQRPASEEDLERWLMYWSVLGFIVGVEYLAEWLISWVPFYYTIKTTFLLYLALPQTRGSSFIYINYLQPFFYSHESQIDAALASFKAKVYLFVQQKVRVLWDHVTAAAGQQAAMDPATNAGAPPSLGDPVSGPVQLATSLWRSYGPGILASGTAFLRQSATNASRPPASQTALNTPPTSYLRTDSSQSVLERRRQLEAELAALSSAAQDIAAGVNPASTSIPFASAQSNPSRTSSDSNLRNRERTISGKFEEIGLPNEVEGYEVGDADASGSARPPNARASSSWFGWGGSSKGGYERVKSD